MSYSVRLADLANMPVEDSTTVLDELARNAVLPQNGQRAEIAARIRAFESQYGVSSEEMLQSLAEGRQETPEVTTWRFLLRVRELSGGQSRT